MKKLLTQLSFLSILFSPAITWSAAESCCAVENIQKLNQELYTAVRSYNFDLGEIERLMDAGASANACPHGEKTAIGERCVWWSSCPLYYVLLINTDKRILAVVSLLMRKGASFKCSRNILEELLLSAVSDKKEKLLILLDNGIEVDLDEIQKCLDQKLDEFDKSIAGPIFKEEHDKLKLMIKEKIQEGAQWRQKLPALLGEGMPDPLIRIIGEYAHPYYDHQEVGQGREQEEQQPEREQQRPQRGRMIWI